jgi:GNAT superfamily N-acetyltransferase
MRSENQPGPATPAEQFVHNPPLDATLREQLLDIWVETTNAGGALGLLPPTSTELAEPLATATWSRVEDGRDDLIAAVLDGAPIGWVVLEANSSALTTHWRTVKRLQVHPAHQGNGRGRRLLQAAEDVATGLGLEALHLTVRGGTGTDRFYTALGYQAVGRFPRALRVAPGDDRDEIYMVKLLGGTTSTADAR